MEIKKVQLKDTGAFAPMFLKYLENDPSLNEFIGSFPTPESFLKMAEKRNFSPENRSLLLEVLLDQYGGLNRSYLLDLNLFSLVDERTFTVTTGHQLNIFTGPLYFIFKIITTINLAKKLQEKYPNYKFVPVYWMASEDHDFEEINHFHLFGKKYVWETEQKGPVGRFAPQSLNLVLEQLNDSAQLFEQAYLDSSTLAEAVRVYVNQLFGDYGLIVVDADSHRLKKIFAPVITADLLEQNVNGLVNQTNAALQKAGFDSQAFSRPINFFYLNGSRERIVEENGVYKVLNTDLQFTSTEMRKLIEDHPERFSPNVILRPLYQEMILPNIGYVGGPAEVIYWMQLKAVFDYFNVPFPVLMPRNFGMIINKTTQKKIDKTGLTPTDLFKDLHTLKAEYLERNLLTDHVLTAERSALIGVFATIKEKASLIDKSLEGFVGAETARVLKEVEVIEKRLKKAQETQNEIALSQLDGIKEKLFPNGGLQERHDNFLNFYLNNPSLIQNLIDHFDPFDFAFYQFWE